MIEGRIVKPILCLGDACPDIVLPYGRARQMLSHMEQDEPILCNDIYAQYTPGGSIANTASGLARLGCSCWFAGKAGDDFWGHYLKEAFLKDGVDTRHFILDPRLQTIMVIAVVGEDNDRIPFLVPRENPSHLQLLPQDLPDSLSDEIGWVHTSGIMLHNEPAAKTITEFLEGCAARNIPISLDINLRIEAMGQESEWLRRSIACCNVLFGSGYDELMPLTGKSTPEEASRSLVTKDRVVVCRMGDKGSTLYTHAEESHQPAFNVPVIDTIGAGDVFNSGFLAAVTSGLPLSVANKYGCAAAAMNLMHQGARNCPIKEELMDFLS